MSDFIKYDVQPPKAGELESWITRQLKDRGSALLAFADDGVIWGKLVNGVLKTAKTAPKLSEKTLQQASVFGADCEVRLFRNETGDWKAVRLVDADEWFPESQVLWGNEAKGPIESGFIYASEYRAGIPGQWLPLNEPFGPENCARLEVHHLVGYDEETGEARIVASRLAGLSVSERAKEV